VEDEEDDNADNGRKGTGCKKSSTAQAVLDNISIMMSQSKFWKVSAVYPACLMMASKVPCFKSFPRMGTTTFAPASVLQVKV
jgi:hypothetical protein